MTTRFFHHSTLLAGLAGAVLAASPTFAWLAVLVFLHFAIMRGLWLWTLHRSTRVAPGFPEFQPRELIFSLRPIPVPSFWYQLCVWAEITFVREEKVPR